MGILEALEIEKLKAVKDGVYVCTNPETKEFQLIPLEGVSICVNGKQQALGKLLFSLIESNNQMAKKIDSIISSHNTLISSHKKQIKVLKAQIIELQEERK